LEALASLLSWLVIDALLVSTGRVVVVALSLGRWRGERFGGSEGRVNGSAGALSFKVGDRRVITKSGLAFVGVAVYVAIALVMLAVAAT